MIASLLFTTSVTWQWLPIRAAVAHQDTSLVADKDLLVELEYTPLLEVPGESRSDMGFSFFSWVFLLQFGLLFVLLHPD
jgi:hypothetical protein